MNTKVLLAAVGTLALIGAGCATEPAPVPYIPPNAQPATQVEPTPVVPEPVATSTTPAATSSTTPIQPQASNISPLTSPTMPLAFPGVRSDA
jgi:hypothetical protein